MFPTEGVLLGVDFGTKRVGLAISTPEQSFATPLDTLHRSQPADDARFLCKICNDYRVRGIVIGLPVHMSGDESQKSIQAREFGAWVQTETNLPICFWDERFTSAMAEHHLRESGMSGGKRKQHLDKLAAREILQSFLDAEDRSAPPSAIQG